MNARDPIELERALGALGSVVDFGPEPDIAASVAADLRRGMRPAPARRSLLLRPGFAFGLALVVALTAAVLAFSPAAREAVADLLGIGGVRIELGGEPPATIARSLDLGERVEMAEAQERAGFEVRLPEELGEPSEIYVDDLSGTIAVSAVYPAAEGLPPSTATGVGALFTQFESRLEVDLLKKLGGGGTKIDYTDVDGTPAYWVEGPHTVMVLDASGRPRDDSARLSANSLLWEEDGITYRLEGDFDLTIAARIAASLP